MSQAQQQQPDPGWISGEDLNTDGSTTDYEDEDEDAAEEDNAAAAHNCANGTKRRRRRRRRTRAQDATKVRPFTKCPTYREKSFFFPGSAF